MTTLRLAARLAFSRDVRQRWRQLSVIGAGFVVALLCMASAGMSQAAGQSDERISGRSPVWAQGPADALLAMSARGMELEGFGQFPVVWLEPTPGHEADPATVPPGLSALPGPGEAVLSEGLVAAGWKASDFGLKSSQAGSGERGAIGREGLATRSEGWVYARPPSGRSLGSGGALLYSRGYPGDASSGINFETVPEVPRTSQSLLGIAWMLLAPGAFLLFSAVRALSLIREERAQTLWRFGVSSLRIRGLLAVETSLLLAVGVLPAVGLWLGVLEKATSVPLTVALLMPNALAVSPTASLGVGAGVVLIGAASTAFGRIRGRSVRGDARTVRSWHAIPLLVAFLMMAVGPWLPPSSGARLYLLFGGLLLTFAALPMAMPALVARLGSQLGRAAHPAIWLAGRRLSLRSANLSKPAAMVGALVFVAGAAFALYDRLVAPEENFGSAAPFSAFHVDWRDPRPGDAQAAARASDSLVVIPITGEDAQRPVGDVGSCSQLQPWASSLGQPCLRGSTSLDAAFVQRFHALTGLTLQAGTSGEAKSVFVVAAKEADARVVMKALAGQLPAVNISELGGASKTRDARAGWMLFGWTVATLVLVASLVREIGDRGLASMRDIGHLLRLGLRREEISSSYRWSLFPPVVLAIPIGFLGAVLFALLGYELGITVGNLTRIALVALLAGFVSLVTFVVVLRLQHRMFAQSR